MEQEAKSVYAVRAMRGHRIGGVPTTPRGRDLFLLDLFFCKSYFMDEDLLRPGWSCFQSQNL